MAPTAISSDGSVHSFDGSPSPAPSAGYRGYDHITWWVGNAKQAATYYTTRMGFRHVAKKGLETGSRCFASHVVSNGSATFVLTSPLRPSANIHEQVSEEDRHLLDEMHTHLRRHGDAVKDVAFEVDDVHEVYTQAVSRGAVAVQAPTVISDKATGSIVTAIIRTYGDTTHTLVDRSRFRGNFLPGFNAVDPYEDPLTKLLPPIELEAVDHCVGNQDWDEMEQVCD